jgi:5-methylcytosine-specific restriction endonuclease McrA
MNNHSPSISYSEKLKDPRWQKKRLEILSRDNWTCQCCQAKDKQLHVHHKSYVWGKDPWDSPDDQLETLCDACHEAATEMDRDLREARKELIAAWESWGLYAALTLPSKLTREVADDLAMQFFRSRVKPDDQK